MKVLILYFSATGNTAKMAAVIGERFAEMGDEVTMSNMTPYVSRQEKIDLAPYDGSMVRVKDVRCSSRMAVLASTPLIIPHDRYWKNKIFAWSHPQSF
jgi:multimeric flavodoxin WrbA